MKRQHIDVIVYFHLDSYLYNTFQPTPSIVDLGTFWIIPKRNLEIFDVLASSKKVMLYYFGVYLLVAVTCWIIAVQKNIRYYQETSNIMILIIGINFNQSVTKLPGTTWFRYFVIFCILVSMNLSTAIQSKVSSMIMVPRYDRKIKDVHDIADASIKMVYDKATFRQLTANMDEEQKEKIWNNAIFLNVTPTASEVIENKDHAVLTNGITVMYMRNKEEMVKIRDVCIKTF